MEHKPLRWALVGTGIISSRFAQALARVPGHARQALISRDPARAAGFARQHGFAQVLPLDDPSFSSPNVDVIYIGTPTHTHRDLCLQAIRAGKPFLCEKPMTASASEFEEVLQALREHPVYAMEAMWLKFNPLVRQLAQHVARGRADAALGAPLGLSMQIGYADHRVDDSVPAAADALTVFGCYGIALALELFGEPLRVVAHGRSNGQDQGLLQASMLLDYGTFPVSIECSVIAELPNALHLQGTQENIRIPVSVLDPYRLEINRRTPRSTMTRVRERMAPLGRAFVDLASSRHPLRGSGFRGEIAQSGLHITQGELESAEHPLHATATAHRVMQAVRTSVACGQWVDVQSVNRSR